jgi:hypothetical protein
MINLMMFKEVLKRSQNQGKSATSQLKPGTQISLNLCAKAILFSNT